MAPGLEVFWAPFWHMRLCGAIMQARCRLHAAAPLHEGASGVYGWWSCGWIESICRFNSL